MEADALGEADIAAFAVYPETWEIPPHEHRYVSAHFRPTEMRSYRCRFEAIVADNDDPSTGRLDALWFSTAIVKLFGDNGYQDDLSTLLLARE